VSKADQTYMRNLIRSLRDKRDRYLNLADDTDAAITQAQLKLIAIEEEDKR
jgi:hypothetical protein